MAGTEMRKFDKLTFEEKIAHFYKVAGQAGERWGYTEKSVLKLLNFTENATFKISEEGRPDMIMRVHRLDYATKNSIRTELQWIRDLKAQTNLSLASPIPSNTGEYVEQIEIPELEETRNVVCFEFCKGSAPVDSSDDTESVGALISKIEKIPDAITIPVFKFLSVLSAESGKHHYESKLSKEDLALYRNVGKIAATIHRQSEKWTEPAFYEHMEWDYDGTFGTEWNNFYGQSYRSRKWLSAKDIKILDSCAEVIKERVEHYGKGPARYGMIHSDLRIPNLLKDGENYTVLDFDDCGKGWFMYDVASIVALQEHRSDLNMVLDEIVKGYESVRPISKADKMEIPTFIMMRRLGMLQSLIVRIGSVMGGNEAAELTPEILAFYAKGTVVMAKDYMKHCAATSAATAERGAEYAYRWS